jgi:hypothetical protein
MAMVKTPPHLLLHPLPQMERIAQWKFLLMLHPMGRRLDSTQLWFTLDLIIFIGVTAPVLSILMLIF